MRPSFTSFFTPAQSNAFVIEQLWCSRRAIFSRPKNLKSELDVWHCYVDGGSLAIGGLNKPESVDVKTKKTNSLGRSTTSRRSIHPFAALSPLFVCVLWCMQTAMYRFLRGVARSKRADRGDIAGWLRVALSLLGRMTLGDASSERITMECLMVCQGIPGILRKCTLTRQTSRCEMSR